jgi:hypothetical protein
MELAHNGHAPRGGCGRVSELFIVALRGLCALAVCLPAAAQQKRPDSAVDVADKAIAGLRQVSNQLTEAVKVYEKHLDAEMMLHGSGYRMAEGRRIPGADAGELSGPADMVQTAARKLAAARMLAARGAGYEPVALADSDRVQELIWEALKRMGTGNDAMRRLLMVSVKDLNARTDAVMKARRRELLRARNVTAEAAKKALVALPVPLSEADSAEEQRERAWDLMVANLGIPKTGGRNVRPPEDVPVFPIRFEPGKRFTLFADPFRRVAWTDSGMKDRRGRRLFYQEEWVRRAGTTVSMRWAVALDMATGQHTLLRRYWPREFRGDFEEDYRSQAREYLVDLPARADLTEPAALPTRQEMVSATAEVARSRGEIEQALADFRRGIGNGLAGNEAMLDDELPRDVRENLFAIRAHLAGVSATLDAEIRVRRAVERAAVKIRLLEALAAWVNGAALEQDGRAEGSRALVEAEQRCETEIDMTRRAGMEALGALPPDLSMAEAQFPGLRKGLIVRVRRRAAASLAQELWQFEGARQVKRTIMRIDIDARTGSQVMNGREVRYYRMEAGDTLEGIYDEYSSR